MAAVAVGFAVNWVACGASAWFANNLSNLAFICIGTTPNASWLVPAYSHASKSIPLNYLI